MATSRDEHLAREAPDFHEERVHERSATPIGVLLTSLARELTELINNEFALARAEAGEKISRLLTDVGAMAIGGAVLFAGFLVLLMAAVAGLAEFLPPDMAAWLSPLIVGVLVLLIGYALLQTGISRMRRQDLTMDKTSQSMARNKSLAQDAIRRDRSPMRRDGAPKEEVR